MKKFLIILCLIAINPIANAKIANAKITDEITSPKNPAYRVGTTDSIEIEYKTKNILKTSIVKQNKTERDIENLTYADLSIKKISNELAKTLEMDSNEILADLSLLWQGAASKSETIKFALYKLSNPDSDKPDEKSIKKVLSTIANMSTLVGAGMGNPILSSGAFMGGNLLGIMSEDTKALNYKYTKVNDADMIILVRKIDDLQQVVVNRYYDYLTSRKVLDMTTKITAERYTNYTLAQNGNKNLIIIADAYYRDAIDSQMKARSDYYSKRASLEQLVGSEIFKQFEEIINKKN